VLPDGHQREGARPGQRLQHGRPLLRLHADRRRDVHQRRWDGQALLGPGDRRLRRDELQHRYCSHVDRCDGGARHDDRLGYRLDAGRHRDPAGGVGLGVGGGHHRDDEPAAAEHAGAGASVLEAGSLLARAHPVKSPRDGHGRQPEKRPARSRRPGDLRPGRPVRSAMKTMKRLTALSLIAAMTLQAAPAAFADDSDIFGANIQPNILILFDSSGSMYDEITSAAYASATVYPGVDKCQTKTNPCVSTVVYQSGSNNTYTKYADTVSGLNKASAQTALNSVGYRSG